MMPSSLSLGANGRPCQYATRTTLLDHHAFPFVAPPSSFAATTPACPCSAPVSIDATCGSETGASVSSCRRKQVCACSRPPSNPEHCQQPCSSRTLTASGIGISFWDDRIAMSVRVRTEGFSGLSRGLSGGDILNGCANAIHAGSTVSDPPKWAVTQGMLEREIAKVRKAKVEHSGDRDRSKRRIGFCP